MSHGTLHTSQLLRKIKSTSAFPQIVRQLEQDTPLPTLGEHLTHLCKERELVKEQVIKNANIERTYGHQIFRGIRRPSRDKVIQLAIGLGLTVEEAQKLLQYARMPQLYPKIKRDAAILYGLSHGLSYVDMQCLLEQWNITLLGGAADE